MTTRRMSILAGLLVLPAWSVMAWDLNLGGDRRVEFHGFASQGFLASTDYNYLGSTKDGSFQFNEFGLNASFVPAERTRIMVQGFMFDLGNVNNNQAFLDYASLEYTLSDLFGVRGGRIRRPGGIYNHIQDVDLARTAVLLPQGVYNSRWRDFSSSIDGGMAFGTLPLGRAGSLGYEAFGGYMNPDDKGGVARDIQDGLPPAPLARFLGVEPSLITGAQLWWNTPVDGLRFGASGGQVWDFEWNIRLDPAVTGLPETVTRRTQTDIPYVYLSAEYLWKGWTFQAEYYSILLNLVDSIGGAEVSSDKYANDSWYVAVSYRVNNWLELGAYYNEYYVDTADRRGHARGVSSDAYQKDFALSTRFDFTDWWLFKLEGHWIRGTSLLQDGAHNPTRNGDSWWMFAAKTTFSF